MTSKVKQQSAYWHFNVSLLNDKIYVNIIINFWRKWQEMLCDYDDIRMWWDIGKIKIKELSQQYSIGLKTIILDNKICLEAQIKKYEESLIVCKSKIVFDNLRRCKIEPESIIKDESQGALIRSRFNMINKIDKGTTFFFNLEKKNGKSKQMTHLILDNGNVIDNPEVISQHVRDYYSDLFTPKLVVKENNRLYSD